MRGHRVKQSGPALACKGSEKLHYFVGRFTGHPLPYIGHPSQSQGFGCLLGARVVYTQDLNPCLREGEGAGEETPDPYTGPKPGWFALPGRPRVRSCRFVRERLPGGKGGRSAPLLRVAEEKSWRAEQVKPS